MTHLPHNVFHLTREKCLHLLETGQIRWLSPNGNYWQVRQNGAVKRWARTPGAYKIPVKMGIRYYGALTEYTLFDKEIEPYVPESFDTTPLPRFRIFEE